MRNWLKRSHLRYFNIFNSTTADVSKLDQFAFVYKCIVDEFEVFFNLKIRLFSITNDKIRKFFFKLKKT